jgi:hypothetical protein
MAGLLSTTFRSGRDMVSERVVEGECPDSDVVWLSRPRSRPVREASGPELSPRECDVPPPSFVLRLVDPRELDEEELSEPRLLEEPDDEEELEDELELWSELLCEELELPELPEELGEELLETAART